MQRSLLLGLAGIALGTCLSGCGSTRTFTVTVTRTMTRTVTNQTTTTTASPGASAACASGDLGGSFSVVRGSAGAGQISYALTLTNTSGSSCWVSGIPGLQLLDAQGGALPTSASSAHPEQGTAAKIELQAGGSAKAEARFSPDVDGPGEPQTRPSPGRPAACEPIAEKLRVTVSGGGTVIVAVKPPTPVCEHGALSMSLLSAA